MGVMSAGLVDFHCHLDLYPDYEAAFAECDQKGMYTLTVTTTPKAWPHNRDLAAKTRHVRVALGLHPQLVAERGGELPLWEEYLPQATYVGEVGLDAGPRFYRSLDLQKQVFERVLRCCTRAGGKILTVHNYRTASAVLDMVETHLPPTRGKIVLHWFTGTKAEARRAVDLGCYFSVNTEMLKSERHQAVVATLPLERLLTETDGPFTQIDGRPSRPADVSVAVQALADLRGTSPSVIADSIRQNLRELMSQTAAANETI